jgi:hypothetical protein
MLPDNFVCATCMRENVVFSVKGRSGPRVFLLPFNARSFIALLVILFLALIQLGKIVDGD